MDKLNYSTLIKVLKLNIIIWIFVTMLARLFLDKYSIIMLLGLIVAFINFTINSMLSHKLLKDGGIGLVILYFISFIIRVVLPGVIAFVFFTSNIYKALLFLGGYCLHFASLIIISAKVLFDKEGK